MLFFRKMVATLHGFRAVVKLFLPIAVLISMQTANGQNLRQALEPRLVGLSAKSHSAVLLWDMPRNENLAAVQMEVFAEPRCLGSLVKPLLLLAYLNDHRSDRTSDVAQGPPKPTRDDFSAHQTLPVSQTGSALRPCVGRRTSQCPVECWYKPGHGKLEMRRALAVSCNQYFFQLAKQTSPMAFFKTLAALRLSPGSKLADTMPVPPETMIGLDSNLTLVPLHVLKVYGALIADHVPAETGGFTASAFARAILLDGLRLSAVEGTSVLAQQALPPNHQLLGKTGTSPGFVGGRYLSSRTDGWFLGFYPAAQPVLAVMVYYPGGLGAKDAAPLGGEVIRTYLEMVK